MIRIDSGYFVAAVVIEHGVVVRTAPILKYMKGWPQDKVIGYAVRKRWKYLWI